MQEVEGALHGERNYSKLKGQTGPLVYPAGFVVFYSGLHKLTAKELSEVNYCKNDDICDSNLEKRYEYDVYLAQHIFSFFHTLQFFIVANIYALTLPKSASSFLTFSLLLSKRLRSIFVLRLFNDGIALTFAHASFLIFISSLSKQRKKYIFIKFCLGVMIFSFAASIKMNVVLFLPGLAVILLDYFGLLRCLVFAALFLAVQFIVAFPFLQFDPYAYIYNSIQLDRVFFHKWTVSYSFLSPEQFLSFQTYPNSLVLPILTLLSWFWLCNSTWILSKYNTFSFVWNRLIKGRLDDNKVDLQYARGKIAWCLFTIYICFDSVGLRVLILLLIEICFNIYPPRSEFGTLLQICHIAIFLRIMWTSHNRLESKLLK
eukprot:snap_masked-scaffold_14-processed-gene-1.7-mRNA-1 protein AED:0.18 eAED:0.27 QI:0/0/0/1/1/1/2/0/372